MAKITVMLDARARRADMTSREVASVFCGVLGGLVRLYGRALVLDVLVYAAKVNATLQDSGAPFPHASEIEGTMEESGERFRVALNIVGATYVALATNAAPGAVSDALQWIVEHPTVLDAVEMAPTPSVEKPS